MGAHGPEFADGTPTTTIAPSFAAHPDYLTDAGDEAARGVRRGEVWRYDPVLSRQGQSTTRLIVVLGIRGLDRVDRGAVRLQREGRSVAMVGDGINDAAALAQADLGLASNSLRLRGFRSTAGQPAPTGHKAPRRYARQRGYEREVT